ncbi:MAG: M1 family metallopeptidase [Bacteroidota bacterium]
MNVRSVAECEKKSVTKNKVTIAGCFKLLLVILTLPVSLCITAQPNRWQQRIKYAMDVNLDVATNLITGSQTITYYNNSPDTLRRVFMHLFWNAFKPGSMMDENSRSTETLVVGRDTRGKDMLDFDRRFKKRLADLKPEEQGWCKVTKISVNGKLQQTILHETILEVTMEKPILPKTSVVFNTAFNCQVPKLSRRSGRDNAEGIRYSLGQWYPKIVEYDYEGWHADPYIAREFYGVWGDYDVNITLDKTYKLGATGVLQNAAAIGWGYDKEGTELKSIPAPTRTWKFSAKNVHDFMWAADPTYKHITRKTINGPLLHFIYKTVDSVEAIWQRHADSTAMCYPFMSKTFGPYPYTDYSVIQGGGGGTEYPMATLVVNHSLGTFIHEWCHSWYQMMLGSNENLYGFMDEGFTSYADTRTLSWLRNGQDFAFKRHYDSYYRLVASKFDEPMGTPANFTATNMAYNGNAYTKGAVFMVQLGYVVGETNLDKILLEYYKQWRFKHPDPNDFMSVAQKVTGLELQWYKQYFLYTTKTADYGIDSLWSEGAGTNVRLKMIGKMAMPLDVQITFKDSSKEWHYIPLDLMFGAKPAEDSLPRKVYPAWPFTHAEYVINTSKKITDIVSVEIDPSQRLADVDKKNNKLEIKW